MAPSTSGKPTERRSRKENGHLKYARLTLPNLTEEERGRIWHLVATGCAKGASKRHLDMELTTTASISSDLQHIGAPFATTGSSQKKRGTVKPGRPAAITEETATKLRLALILQPTATAEHLISLTGCTCSIRTVQRSMAALREEADLLAEYVIEEYNHDILDRRRGGDNEMPRTIETQAVPTINTPVMQHPTYTVAGEGYAVNGMEMAGGYSYPVSDDSARYGYQNYVHTESARQDWATGYPSVCPSEMTGGYGYGYPQERR